MASQNKPSPRKARKSMRSSGTIIADTNTNEPLSDPTISSSTQIFQKKQARKSTGTRRLPPSTDVEESQVSGSSSRRNTSVNSQDVTLPLSQPSSSRDLGLSDSDVESRRPRKRISQNTTLALSPISSMDQTFSDSWIPPKNKGRRKKIVQVDESSSSPPDTSEDSEAEEVIKKLEAKKNKKTLKGVGINESDDKIAQLQGLNINNLANQCVYYILVVNRNKQTIKKKDIISHVFEGRGAAAFPEVLMKAGSILKKTFGFEIMEIRNKKNEYLLVNILSQKYDIQEFVENSPLEHQKQGFVFYILTLIFMNENSIMEDELWNALEPLGIEVNSKKPHPLFGDVQKFVSNTLVKQLYLERREVSKDPVQFELLWGERAHKEVAKTDLLEFACKVSDTEPDQWILQYKDAYGNAPGAEADMD